MCAKQTTCYAEQLIVYIIRFRSARCQVSRLEFMVKGEASIIYHIPRLSVLVLFGLILLVVELCVVSCGSVLISGFAWTKFRKPSGINKN